MLRFSLLFLVFTFWSPVKMYQKDYYDNGQLKAQGWLVDNNKEDFWKFYYANGKMMQQGHYKNDRQDGYWYFYNSNGTLEKEGHFNSGKKTEWWLFYDGNGKISHKCQLQDGIKNGYCLTYKDEELASAEKYKNGKKIKEWFSFSSFRKENKLSDLK